MPKAPAAQPAQSLRLLRTKLFIPRAHPDLVARPWLANRLDEGLRCKLTLVSAPAGFGKTTLLGKWILDRQASSQTNQKFCWVSLDAGDNDPTRFWSYCLAALQTTQPDAGKIALAMLQSPQPPDIETILTEILNDIDLATDDCVLVLDDYHVIENTAIHQALSFLLEHMSPHMHLVIASRSEPELPMHRMRVRRELVELNLTDLRFTLDEAATFLNQVMKLNIAQEDVSRLEKLTEGWVAGLQLAALSMHNVQDISGFLGAFTGSHRYIFDYLAQEVLNRQPAHIQDFLLRSSILERMNASLCDSLSPQNSSSEGISPISNPGSNLSSSQAILEHLEHTNLFIVPLDQQRHWYRYHHLFSDFLQTRLEQSVSPEVVSALHMRACAWYEQNGLLGEALRHAMAAHQPGHAAALLSQAAEEMFIRSELITIIKWLQALPDDIVRDDLRLNMIYAWAQLATGHIEAVEPILLNMERILGVTADGSPQTLLLPPATRGVLAEISNLRASHSFNLGDLAASMRLSVHARAYLAEDVDKGCFQSRLGLLSIASFNLAVALEFSGNVPQALQSFGEVIRLSRQDQNNHLLPMAISHQATLLAVLGRLHQAFETCLEAQRDLDLSEHPSPLAGLLYTGLGNLYYEWNDLAQAETCLNKGIELGRQWSSWEILTAGYFGLSHCQVARGNLQAALTLLQELEALRQKLQLPWAEGAIQGQLALVSVRLGDNHAAARWADGMGAALQAGIPYVLEAEAITLARVLLYLGRNAEADALLEQLLTGAEAGQRWGRVIPILVLRSLSLAALGENTHAAAALERALQLAEPQGYLRVFLDEGEPLRKMLSAANRQLSALSPQPPVLAIPPAPPPGHPSSTTAPLSARELEVLLLMAKGLTNQQIAASLYISLNTVKTHIKNILGHLDVENRTQAVDRARQMGLLQ